MKIVILEHEPFQQRKREHYFIDKFKECDIEIEYWSLHKMLPYLKKVNYPYQETDDFVKYFDDKVSFFSELALLDVKNTILIIEFWYTPQTIDIFKFLFDKNFKWVKIDYYLNPTVALDKVVSTKEMVKWSLLDGSLFRKSINLLKRKFLNQKYNNPDILFHTGANNKLLYKAKNYVSIDYYDLLTFKNIEKKKFLEFEYIVFLDIMLVEHPDIARSGSGIILDKKVYYNKLNEIFEFIENELKLPIVIASHPKANYTNEFGSRLVIKNKTAELASHSEMVLTHGSLSISYALLTNKRICYIDFKELFSKNLFLRNIQESLYHSSNLLDAITIDEKSAGNILYKPSNINKYNNFLNDFYRKKKSSSADNFSIIKDSLLNILNEYN